VEVRPHQTVLLAQAVAALRIKPEGVYVDGTYGRGGHSQMILEQLAPAGRLIIIDKDADAVADAERRFGADPRTYIYRGSFAALNDILAGMPELQGVDGILLDLGVSSPQLDEGERGFSFRQSGPLDMRMDQAAGLSAAEWLMQVDEQTLAGIIKEYGEERFSKRVARAILRARDEAPISTTTQLAAIVAQAIPTRERGKDPATRTFQAIRIYLNQELEDLTQCLEASIDLLNSGGRLVVISFHSLEDRIVKRFMRKQSQGDQLPIDLPIQHVEVNAKLKLIGKAIKPDEDEIKHNARARSAIMRVAERV
jgi:16S rRNA (cytosine1402-N4)-methyltransferase